MSADPLEIHSPGDADANVYAYVRGRALKSVDPIGLREPSDPPRLMEMGVSPPVASKVHSGMAAGVWRAVVRFLIPPGGPSDPVDIKIPALREQRKLEQAAEERVVDVVAPLPKDPISRQSAQVAEAIAGYSMLAIGGISGVVGGVRSLKGVKAGSIPRSAPKPSSFTVTAEEVGEALAEMSRSTTKLYHKGELKGGAVDPNKVLSTGTDRELVEKLDRAGRVHEFDVPTRKLDEWFQQFETGAGGGAQRKRDLDLKTGVVQEEVRVQPPTSGELNKYKTE